MLSFRNLKILIVLLIGISAIWFGLRVFKQSRSTPPPKHVILITVDTLRADHLGCYDYAPANTPNIDRWAREGSQFMSATATTPLTLPSHSSMMTGYYPLAHGVRDNGGFYLDQKWQTLAETLKAGGFQTGGFVSAFVLDRRWGIAQGFDEYFDHFELSKFKMVSLDSVQRRGDETLNKALEWMEKKKNDRFFSWIHLYDPHTPYDPPEPFRADSRKQPFGYYDGEISFVDSLMGQIDSFLTKNDLKSNTMIVFTSDHGESLGEHQESGHGFFIYDATTHVPLIVSLPGTKPAKITEQVRSVDIYPTIASAVGVDSPQGMEGTSLLPLLQGKSLGRKLTAYSESYYPRYHYGWSELKSLRTSEYKYIHAPKAEFYRLSQDSKEKNNLYNTETKKASPFETELQKLVSLGTADASSPQPIDDDSLEKLQALGYIGSFTGSIGKEDESNLADPKDKIRLYNLIKMAQWKSAENKTEEAMADIAKVLNEDTNILEAHLVEGNLFYKEKDFGRARKSFQNALSINPDFSAAIFGVAKTFQEEEQWEAAIAGFQRLTELDPKDPKPYFHLGDIALMQKEYPQAVSYFQKMVEIDPEQANSRSRLGACYLEMKDYDRAETEFKKALELNPRMPNANFNMALIHEERGDLQQAIASYRKELETFPETYAAHFNLSRIYRHMGNKNQEREELEKCIKENSDYGVAYLYLAKNMMDAGEDLNKAKSLTEQGMEKTLEKENQTFGYFLLADIYNRLGQPQLANANVQRARALLAAGK